MCCLCVQRNEYSEHKVLSFLQLPSLPQSKKRLMHPSFRAPSKGWGDVVSFVAGGTPPNMASKQQVKWFADLWPRDIHLWKLLYIYFQTLGGRPLLLPIIWGDQPAAWLARICPQSSQLIFAKHRAWLWAPTSVTPMLPVGYRPGFWKGKFSDMKGVIRGLSMVEFFFAT